MSKEPIQPSTAIQIKEWIHNATLKRWQLLLNATDPSPTAQEQAFSEMSELCKDAIEEVRVTSAKIFASNGNHWKTLGWYLTASLASLC